MGCLICNEKNSSKWTIIKVMVEPDFMISSSICLDCTKKIINTHLKEL